MKLACRIAVLVSLLCLGWSALATSKPGIKVYCSVGEPLGLVYRDLGRGTEERLFTDAVLQALGSRDGLLAVLRPGALVVYRRGIRLQTLKVNDTQVELVGWLPGALIYRDAAGLHALDLVTGRRRSAGLPPNTVAVVSFSHGTVAVCQSGPVITITISQSTHPKRRRIRIRGWYYPPGQTPVVIGTRYVVIMEWPFVSGTPDATGPSRLLVVDLRSATARPLGRLDLDMGYCQGRTGRELLGGTPVRAHVPGETQATDIACIDIPTLRYATLFRVSGQVEVVGLTTDRKQLLTVRTKHSVGPGTLILSSFPGGQVRATRENVYECWPAD